jgi:DNA-binding LacI/PurR family transcriptional regulator
MSSSIKKSAADLRGEALGLAAGEGRVTLCDVAAKSGMSLATVSRALNGSDAVARDTALRVRAAADELGFRFNQIGRNLRSTRTFKIGVMLPTLIHPVFAEFLQALEDTARATPYSLSFVTTQYNAANEEQASETLLAHRVDGLILTVANAVKSKLLDKLERERVPFVLVYNQTHSSNSQSVQRPSVSVDNRLAAAHMVQHLLALGHTRVRMISGPFAQSDRARQRYKGYADAMKAAQHQVQLPIELDFLAQDVKAVLQDLMSGRERPSALFCSSDQLALRAMHALHELGISVPDDVSVAGFDGSQMSQWMRPGLATVVQPNADIARAAFDMLTSLLRGERVGASALLHHSLRSGGSVALYRN